jgi:hypothetical protein
VMDLVVKELLLLVDKAKQIPFTNMPIM